MHKHLTSSKKCRGYLDGKLRDLGLYDDVLADFREEANPGEEWSEEEDEAPYEPFEFEPMTSYINQLHFIPPGDTENGADRGPIAGPGPSTAANIIQRSVAAHQQRVFDDLADPRDVVWTQGAGHVIRWVDPPRFVQSDARDEEGDVPMADEDSKYFPFSSELDWRVARWAIKDGPGHNAFDRLLEIPGVCWLINPNSETYCSNFFTGSRKAWIIVS